MSWTFERSYDFDLIKSIITHPRVWPHVTDDSAPPIEKFRPNLSEKLWHIICRKDGVLMGLFIFLVREEAWEVHTCLLPTCYGMAAEAARALLSWIWENTDCRRVTSMVPEYNRLAYALASHAGMKVYRKDVGTYTKNGDKHDVFYFEYFRPAGSGEPCQ